MKQTVHTHRRVAVAVSALALAVAVVAVTALLRGRHEAPPRTSFGPAATGEPRGVSRSDTASPEARSDLPSVKERSGLDEKAGPPEGPVQAPPLGLTPPVAAPGQEVPQHSAAELDPLLTREEAARLAFEGSRALSMILTQDGLAASEAGKKLGDSLGSLAHRIKVGREGRRDVRALEQARRHLVLEMGRVADSPVIREDFYWSSRDALLRCLGASRDPAAVEWLVRHIDYFNPFAPGPIGFDKKPAYEALSEEFGIASAPLIFKHARVDTSRDYCGLVAGALKAVCGTHVRALEQADAQLTDERDPARSAWLRAVRNILVEMDERHRRWKAPSTETPR